MPTRAHLTYSDYAALPDDGRRYELHHGELSEIPTPGTLHQRAIIALGSRLYDHVRARGLGEVLVAPTDCILSNVTVMQPDVLYIATDRLAIISERGIEGAPTQVVEVLSPSTAHLDRGRKMKLYAEHGVPFYWIVDPESRSVEAYALAGAEYARAGLVTSEPAVRSNVWFGPSHPRLVLFVTDDTAHLNGAHQATAYPKTRGIADSPAETPAT